MLSQSLSAVYLGQPVSGRSGNHTLPLICDTVPFTVRKIIADARVLGPEFVPDDVVHRDGEINHLTSTLRPITNGKTAEPAFLYGPSGTGKTCIAQYALDSLREAVIELETQYVNCWEDYSRYKTLYRILEGLNKTVDIHRQSTPTDILLERLRDYDGPPYVVILDEVDQLHDKDLLYELYRLRRLSMVLIANDDEEFFAELSNRVTSRFQTSARIRFSPYTQEELISILDDRVRWGLRHDAITDELVERIAGAAGGDARVAIGILRVAARRTTRAGQNAITDAVIEQAVSEAKTEIRQKTLAKLNTHQQILYDIITDHGEITPRELYTRYQERASNPRSNRMVRNYLSKLYHYNLIAADGENRGRTYRPLSNPLS